jgi:myo-inositol-1(or 4)-monophosphatase
MTFPSDRAAALQEIVAQAGKVAQKGRLRLDSELKPDGSIVTNADREVELFLRSQLQAFAPGTTIWGEEFGYEEEGPEGLWVLDPVDGTSNFRFGSPLWGVSVGLVRNGEILLGCIALPDLQESYVAEKGLGSYMNGVRMKPIPAGPIEAHELVTYGDGLLHAYPDIKPPGKMRLTGAFVIDGAFTCMQRFRGLIGRRERLYDIAVCVLMGQECNADIRYTDGSEFNIKELCTPEQIKKPWLIFPRDSGFFYRPQAKGSSTSTETL